MTHPQLWSPRAARKGKTDPNSRSWDLQGAPHLDPSEAMGPSAAAEEADSSARKFGQGEGLVILAIAASVE